MDALMLLGGLALIIGVIGFVVLVKGWKKDLLDLNKQWRRGDHLSIENHGLADCGVG